MKLVLLLSYLLPGASYVSLDGVWRLRIPSEWVAMRSDGVAFLLSRDGPGIQSIRASCSSQDSPFDDLPEELNLTDHFLDRVQKISAGLQRAYAAYSPVVISSGPSGSLGGVMITLEFRNDKGARQRLVSTSFLHNGRYCRIDLLTPAIHYYERDVQALQELLVSIRQKQ